MLNSQADRIRQRQHHRVLRRPCAAPPAARRSSRRRACRRTSADAARRARRRRGTLAAPDASTGLRASGFSLMPLLVERLRQVLDHRRRCAARGRSRPRRRASSCACRASRTAWPRGSAGSRRCAVSTCRRLQRVAAVDEQRGRLARDDREPGRAGEAGQPGQPLGRRRHVFAHGARRRAAPARHRAPRFAISSRSRATRSERSGACLRALEGLEHGDLHTSRDAAAECALEPAAMMHSKHLIAPAPMACNWCIAAVQHELWLRRTTHTNSPFATTKNNPEWSMNMSTVPRP